VADISETTNVASGHPKIVQRLQAAYDAHVVEITANRRPTAELVRPPDAVSPNRPGGQKKKSVKKTKT
jgi:arylsulfatase A